MDESQIYSANSLDEISELVSKCDRCELHKTKICDVPGKGNANADILFIGEAPGKNEDLSGEPFVGFSGKFLTEMLKGIGLDKDGVFITNMVKHRPPNNRDPKPNEIDACWPYLIRQIELVNPKLIVFLGRHAMKRIFPEYVISEVHGKAFKKEFLEREQTFLALYHPMTARFGKMRDILKSDFAKIPEILKTINN